jgi:hypothetical protein
VKVQDDVKLLTLIVYLLLITLMHYINTHFLAEVLFDCQALWLEKILKLED